jgi:RecA-family ATPase
VYVRVNPMEKHGKSDDEVQGYRHCLVEADKGTKEEQLGAIRKLELPISAIIDSGGKSVHAWVRIDAKNEEEYVERVALVHKFCKESLGLDVDDKNKNPSRYSRLPYGKRTRIDKEGNPVRETPFIPSREWQNVPDWAAIPGVVEIKMDLNGKNMARWDDPPVPETVIDKRTGKPQSLVGNVIIDTQRLLAVNLTGKRWEDWREGIEEHVDDGLPDIECFGAMDEEGIQKPSELVEGVLHQGSKMVIGAPSKARKTWIVMDLAISILKGIQWMGFHTNPGRVLYVNFELQRFFCKDRLEKIARSKGLDSEDIARLDVLNLRGHCASALEIIPKIERKARMNGGYSAVILDPTYKMLGDLDENQAGDMSKMMNEFEKIAVRLNAAIIFATHFAKGNWWQKDPVDRISGSGVFGRDPDAIMVMSPYAVEGVEMAFTVDFILRNHKPEPSVVVQFGRWQDDDWVFHRTKFNPKNGKKPGKKSMWTASDLLGLLYNGPMTHKNLKISAKELGMTDNEFRKQFKVCRDEGLIEQPMEGNRPGKAYAITFKGNQLLAEDQDDAESQEDFAHCDRAKS